MSRVIFSRHVSMRMRLKAVQNAVACTFFLSMTAIVIIMTWFEIIPHFYDKDATMMMVHKSSLVYLSINVLGNFLLCVFTNSSTRTLHQGRNHYSVSCEKCKLPKPKRSHHCGLCQTCILRQDHHCFFMSVCIGYRNQKHFIMYCFYMSVSTFYFVIFLTKYLHSLYGVIFYGPQTFMTLLADVLFDVYNGGEPSGYYVFLLALLYCSLAMGIMSTGLFLWQIMIAGCGQTSHEAWYGDETYSKASVFSNLRDVFGLGWVLVIFLPLPLSQPGCGLYGTDNARASPEKKKL